MSIRLDVISIGTLARNRVWNEAVARRTSHATCSLIRAGKRTILVDPGLPSSVIEARLNERTGLETSVVTDVFLTHIANHTAAGLEAFEHAQWMTSEAEIESLRQKAQGLRDEVDEDLARAASSMEGLLRRLKVAPDKLASGVDLFPLAGYTPGTAGLLVSAAVTTTLLTGPAVASFDHFVAGQVLPESVDVTAAGESLREAYEIADVIVPGFDNLFINPRQFGG